MKKSLLALAVLGAAAGAASAQSSVTIWGIVDLGVARMNDGGSIAAFSGAGPRNTTSVKQGWQSRLGFRGTEDLGDGLQAFFDLETRLNADDGTSLTPFWTGRSIVGLKSKRWGEAWLGRDYLPVFYPSVALDPFNWNTVGQMGMAYTQARYAGADSAPRNNNAAFYRTPDMGGLTALVSYAFGENGTARGSAIGGNVIYAKGPLYLAGAFDRADNAVDGLPGARLLWLGGAYDFGVVRPRVSVARSKAFSGAETKSYMVGVSVPAGNGRVLAGVSRVDPDGLNNNATKVGLGYHYDFSKRTMLYTNIGSARTQGLTRSTGIDVGMRHSF
jgi:predicted porin